VRLLLENNCTIIYSNENQTSGQIVKCSALYRSILCCWALALLQMEISSAFQIHRIPPSSLPRRPLGASIHDELFAVTRVVANIRLHFRRKHEEGGGNAPAKFVNSFTYPTACNDIMDQNMNRIGMVQGSRTKLKKGVTSAEHHEVVVAFQVQTQSSHNMIPHCHIVLEWLAAYLS
jgi:hypothetical protein